MFGFNKKKKQKLDPKIRFQNRQFNQKLQQARTFKRTIKPAPETNIDRVLARVGLGSRLAQIGVGILVLGVLYIVYAQNFLTLQDITIEGLEKSEADSVEAAIRSGIGNAPFYNPQRNLFFLSNFRVSEAALSISSVYKIDSIERNYKTKSLKVVVQAKHERFLVRTADKVFDVYNDGTVKGLAGLDRASWETTVNPSMAKIDIPGNITVNDKKEFITPETITYLTQIQEELKGIVGSTLSNFGLIVPETKPAENELPSIEEQVAELESQRSGDKEIAAGEVTEEETPAESELEPAVFPEFSLPIHPEELNIFMQKGDDQKRTFRVIVDTKENPRELVLRLNLLLSQTNPERYNNLSYIDLRIQNKAFICLLNTVCDK